MVFEAEDADEAIDILSKRSEIRIVLTDIQMKRAMDGLRLSHYVRDRYPPVLIAVVSGAIRPSAADLPDKAVFVPKPFDPRHILAEIERMSA